MSRVVQDSLVWAAYGDELVRGVASGLSDDVLRAPSGLAGWSVGNLVAHVAANADALLNLVRWAKTGVETPMYAGAEDRAEGIAKGDRLSAADAIAWLDSSSQNLTAGFDSLNDDEWANVVVTAQGRVVPATDLPFLRSREGMIHAVDLSASIGRDDLGFSGLPQDFLDALVEDICAKRGLSADKLPAGPKAEVAAWLAGRPHTLTGAPELGAWL
jgi:maleylpyruvate isomerase